MTEQNQPTLRPTEQRGHPLSKDLVLIDLRTLQEHIKNKEFNRVFWTLQQLWGSKNRNILNRSQYNAGTYLDVTDFFITNLWLQGSFEWHLLHLPVIPFTSLKSYHVCLVGLKNQSNSLLSLALALLESPGLLEDTESTRPLFFPFKVDDLKGRKKHFIKQCYSSSSEISFRI